MIDLKEIKKVGLYDYVSNNSHKLDKNDIIILLQELDFKIFEDLGEDDYKVFAEQYINAVSDRMGD